MADQRSTQSRRGGFAIRSGRFTFDGVQYMRYEPAPWLYHYTDPRYARDWSYTLVTFVGGLMMRFYDWEGRPVRV